MCNVIVGGVVNKYFVVNFFLITRFGGEQICYERLRILPPYARRFARASEGYTEVSGKLSW